MKKILITLFIILFVTGCGNNTARNAVDTYLKKYKSLSSEVLLDMEKIIDGENLNKEEKDKYREVLKKQYKDLSFDIKEEEYNDEVSYVTVKIQVYDLYKAESDAHNYLENHRDEFNNSLGEYDKDKYIMYRLDKMKDTTNRIEYTIIFTVIKENNKYVVEQPTENDLKKIHGIYNYEIA